MLEAHGFISMCPDPLYLDLFMALPDSVLHPVHTLDSHLAPQVRTSSSILSITFHAYLCIILSRHSSTTLPLDSQRRHKAPPTGAQIIKESKNPF